MAFGEITFGESPYGEGSGGATVQTAVGLAVAGAAGLAPVAQGDTVTVSTGLAESTALGFTPAVTQQATVAVALMQAVSYGLTPALTVDNLTMPLAKAAVAALSATFAEVISGGTDTSNAMNGRSRGGLSTGTVTRPIAAVPAALVTAQKYDKTAAYPTPTMVKGRPT